MVIPSGPGTFFLGVSFLGVFSGVIFHRIQSAQPTPYLDEVFHVPQTQKFCNGTFDEWDPKITTLPGTYLLAAGMLKFVQFLKLLNNNVSEVCSTRNLRLFNFVLAIQNFHILRSILFVRMKDEPNRWKVTLVALNMVLFPVLHFFSYLYYTDVASIFWVLAMHSLYLKGRHWGASVCGLFAILTRQTNVAWVVMHGMLQGLKAFERVHNEILAKNKENGKRNKKQKEGQRLKLFSVALVMNIMENDLPGMMGYAVVTQLFIAFVLWNGGIVVGDKSAHQVSFNVPQLGYFAVVYGVFCAPFILMRIRRLLQYMKKYASVVALGGLLFVLAVHFNTVAHPYLLADNRHYTFYVWKRIYEANIWARYALIPGYLVVWSFIVGTTARTVGYGYAFALFACTCVQMVPQLLMEFRYFIPIYLFARMAIPNPTWKELILEFLLNVAVNIATVYLFLYRPFPWPGVKDLQRFMW